jgi:hypothetical protein
MNTTQQKLLGDFIKTFLPSTNTKRKNSGNELQYIHSTLDRVCIQQFGFNVTQKETIYAFTELGYNIYTKKSEWNPDTKIYQPSQEGTSVRLDGVYADFNAAFIYFDVKPEDVRLLMKTTATLPPNTNLDKVAKTHLLKEAIDRFKAR